MGAGGAGVPQGGAAAGGALMGSSSGAPSSSQLPSWISSQYGNSMTASPTTPPTNPTTPTTTPADTAAQQTQAAAATGTTPTPPLNAPAQPPLPAGGFQPAGFMQGRSQDILNRAMAYKQQMQGVQPPPGGMPATSALPAWGPGTPPGGPQGEMSKAMGMRSPGIWGQQNPWNDPFQQMYGGGGRGNQLGGFSRLFGGMAGG